MTDLTVITERTEYYEITSESEDIFRLGLGSQEEPDIETLVDSLLSWEGNAVFMSGMNSQDLLEFFLEEARFCPIRTAPIIEIILEESPDYFNGSKSAEAVSRFGKSFP